MAFTPGEFMGLTEEAYTFLATYEGFDKLAGLFTPVEAGNGTYYAFTGEEGDFFDFIEGTDLDPETYGLGTFVYILSTNSVAGI